MRGGRLYAAMVRRYGFAILLSLVVCGAVAAWLGVSAQDLRDVLGQSLVSPSGLLDDLRTTTPDILTGVAFAIGARAGIFNLGLEGQFYWGGLAAALVGIYLPLPSYVSIPIALAAGAVAGAAWAWPAALLKRRLGINELVTTLMGNYIAVLITSLIVKTWFLGDGYVVSSLPIRPSAAIPALSPISDANLSVVLAIALPIGCSFVLARTGFGFALRAISSSLSFARYAGVPVERDQDRAFLLSGAVAGLVGATEVLGVQHRFVEGFAGDIPLDGLLVSILAGGHPIGIMAIGIFFGVLRNIGFVLAQLTDVSSYLITLIFAVFIMIFISEPLRHFEGVGGKMWRKIIPR